MAPEETKEEADAQAAETIDGATDSEEPDTVEAPA